MGQCFDCGVETTIVSEKLNVAGDMKTLTFGCGHTLTVGVQLSLSRFSTSELREKLRYQKRLVAMRNIRKATRDGAQTFIVTLEAELADRRA